MDEAKLRAWWSHRQGLDGKLAGEPAAQVLEKTGWARSVGGSGPYLGFFARAGLRRQAVDDAILKLEIQELPSARGCTYVVPACDFALALKVGHGFSDEGRTAEKLGVTSKEIDRLGSSIVKALAKGPLSPEELRTAAGGAVRNLGEEGKRRGLTSTLPLALGRLQAEGEIRRIPANGRLDQQRYRYALWRPNPLAGCTLSSEEAYSQLARRFFSWINPATVAEFQWFSGLGVKAAEAVVDSLSLKPLQAGSDRLVFPGDQRRFAAFRPSRKHQYVLVSSLDGIFHLRRDARSLFAPEDRGRNVFHDRGLMDLTSNAILDRGRLVGFWEYDVESASIAWMAFVPGSRGMEEEVERTENLIRSDLGDARSYSLDSPRSRAPRIAALRRAPRSRE